MDTGTRYRCLPAASESSSWVRSACCFSKNWSHTPPTFSPQRPNRSAGYALPKTPFERLTHIGGVAQVNSPEATLQYTSMYEMPEVSRVRAGLFTASIGTPPNIEHPPMMTIPMPMESPASVQPTDRDMGHVECHRHDHVQQRADRAPSMASVRGSSSSWLNYYPPPNAPQYLAATEPRSLSPPVPTGASIPVTGLTSVAPSRGVGVGASQHRRDHGHMQSSMFGPTTNGNM